MVIRIREDVARLKIRVAFVSLSVSIALLILKFSAYFLTNSTAIFSDALESLVNVGTSLFLVASLRLAKKPADMEHPYGHGKAEFLSSGLEGTAIIVAAILIFLKVIRDIFTAHEIVNLGAGLVLIGISALVNAVTGLYLIRMGKRNSSVSLEADGRHLMTDVITSVAVFIGILLVKLTGIVVLDMIVAAIVAVYIAIVGIKILWRSLGGMLDEVDAENLETIKTIIEGDEFRCSICGYHRLRSRKSGGFTFVDFHLLMPRYMSISETHIIATQLENRIATVLGDAGVMAHIEPCKDRYCSTCKIKGCEIRSLGSAQK